MWNIFKRKNQEKNHVVTLKSVWTTIYYMLVGQGLLLIVNYKIIASIVDMERIFAESNGENWTYIFFTSPFNWFAGLFLVAEMLIIGKLVIDKSIKLLNEVEPRPI